MAASATLRILRYDPSADTEPAYKTYEVPDFDPETGPLTVLKALHWINLHTEPISYDYNCRRGNCGLCTMMIDGIPKLACLAPLALGKETTLEPLKGFPVIRDLVVDTSKAYRQFVMSAASIKTQRPDKILQTNVPAELWWDTLSHLNACRECMACYATCTALQTNNKWDSFIGPGAMQQIYARHVDTIDEADRVAQAVQAGVFECVQCGLCNTVCAAGIPIKEHNKALMDAAEARGLKPAAADVTYWPII